MSHVTIAIPLVVGVSATACTVVIHGLGVLATLHFVRRQHLRGRAGVGFWIDLWIVATTVMISLGAHVISICLWAVLFVLSGEFEAFGTALYHSGMNYTTLGYGDIVMTPEWRMLAPIEAADGLLMFGITTGMIFTVIQELIPLSVRDSRT